MRISGAGCTGLRPDDLEQMTAWVRSALETPLSSRELSFAVIDRASNRAVGSTRYLGIDPTHKD